MATTATWLLRYPLSSNTVNVPQDMQNLATDTDAALTSVKNPPGCAGVRSAALAVVTSTFTDITLPTEEFDNASMFTAGAATFTVPTGFGGLYQCSCYVQWAANGTGSRSIQMQINGVDVDGAESEQPPAAAAVTRQGFSVPVKLSAGDVVKVRAFQSSGGNLNLNKARFGIVRLTS